MKIREKLHQLNWEDEMEHLVALAYLAGREAAAKEICDKHNSLITAMRERAKNCRYHYMANAIIGQKKQDIIYTPDYAMEHLVALAYLAGREAAAKEICDKHNSLITAMRERAKNCRYHYMANAIIGQKKQDIIYTLDYAGDVTNKLCDEEWPIK